MNCSSRLIPSNEAISWSLKLCCGVKLKLSLHSWLGVEMIISVLDCKSKSKLITECSLVSSPSRPCPSKQVGPNLSSPPTDITNLQNESCGMLTGELAKLVQVSLAVSATASLKSGLEFIISRFKSKPSGRTMLEKKVISKERDIPDFVCKASAL